ncbi:helix-turn-helix transcriptional regulator [Nocardia colli]|uniref:Helix-turn-helix transcriptional regulator n=1 Tax=Nocardia colli TaxID=2545717 RepID=A0A5N0DN06_9NOCA|nr:helix-turn-helix domain-containing protein [Nocardia colli]KAA8877299.1 helix-turn-helix transcriptional regulator [Nocardia colli]
MTDGERPLRDSVEAALEQVPDRWTFLVLRECFFGVRRFIDFQRNLGIARNILADRLDKLVGFGVLERRQYSERPRREEYRLTEKGRDLYGIIVALMHWGDRWLTDRPSLVLTHHGDGGAVEQVLRCTCCEADLDIRDISYGPAAESTPNPAGGGADCVDAYLDKAEGAVNYT